MVQIIFAPRSRGRPTESHIAYLNNITHHKVNANVVGLIIVYVVHFVFMWLLVLYDPRMSWYDMNSNDMFLCLFDLPGCALLITGVTQAPSQGGASGVRGDVDLSSIDLSSLAALLEQARCMHASSTKRFL